MENQLNTFTDSRDGKTYKTVKIGNQIWITENLSYKPGTGIFWVYGNDQKNVEENGYLYDLETAKEVCPQGWHLPTLKEFESLLNDFGGEGEDSYKALISGGNSGFSVFNSGYYDSSLLNFIGLGIDAGFWSSSKYDNDSAWSLGLYGNYKYARMDISPNNLGFSVRCLKDSQ